MLITIGQFLHILRGCIATHEKSIQGFCCYVFSLIISPADDTEDDNDAYHPFSKKSEKSAANKMYKGERGIPEQVVRVAYGRFYKAAFVDEIYKLSDDKKIDLCNDLKKYGVTCTISNVDEVCAEIFHQIINAAYSDLEGMAIDPVAGWDEEGNRIPPTPLTPVRYLNGVIYADGETIMLPVQLAPLSDISSEELPYIDALCELYAEKISSAVSVDTLSSIPEEMQEHLRDQRKAYYSAESIQRSVREVFSDGEEQFQNLKDDAYDGIKRTYKKSTYSSGYDRLDAVLEKITTITLNKSSLINIVGLIGNLEKMGLCHILVNDNVIKSWVKTDG